MVTIPNFSTIRQDDYMANTTAPAGISTENSTFTTIISVVALLAIVALIYFIARGRGAPTPAPESASQPQQQQQDKVSPVQ
jgi:flagellar basal body-associated protein FliL